jgi:hypothetical protein
LQWNIYLTKGIKYRYYIYIGNRVRIRDVIELLAKIATIILAVATIYQCIRGTI